MSDRPLQPAIVRQDDGSLSVYYTAPEHAPAAIRAGLTCRALVVNGETCPCGATANQPRAVLADEVVPISADHADDCPGHEDTLRAAIRAWQQEETP